LDHLDEINCDLKAAGLPALGATKGDEGVAKTETQSDELTTVETCAEEDIIENGSDMGVKEDHIA
jgi:hypothetical protein